MEDAKKQEVQQKKELSKNLKENTEFLDQALAVDKSFDVISKKLRFAGKEMQLYFVDGFAKDNIMMLITNHLASLEHRELVPETLSKLIETHVTYLEVDKEKQVDKLITAVLSGPLVLVIDGYDEALIIDARTYPARNPEEPDVERVVRGARDGFTETLIFNTALTRRRLRDPSLRMEYMQIGTRSKTDICIGYLEDVADPDLVKVVREKLQSIELDGLPMAEKTIEEFVFGKNWNPFPMVRYTERPDVAAVHLLEGHVLIYTDTSPSVMIAPTTLFHHVQHAEEYRQKPVVGAYLRWIRFIGMLASVLLLPIWFLMSQNPEFRPEQLDFIGPKDPGKVPLLVQILVAELGIDLLRMAAVHTPTPLATALGLVAAILIGQVAVEVGLFTNEVILYLAVAAIGTFATPSYELGLANRIMRIFLIVLTAFFKLTGLLVGIGFWLLILMFSRSINTPYLWPLIPLNLRALKDVIIRSPVPEKNKRPRGISPQDPDRVGSE
ncbi:MAG: spore germination protein [Bacillaceae bacterium]|nr:spore germination protein [Bacillaceae bacterium]